MIKRETFELLKQIAVFYDQFEVNQEKVNLWHQMLRDSNFEDVRNNLYTYVKESAFPPKVSDLMAKSTPAMTTPNTDETKEIMKKRSTPAREDVVQRELANMRAILGIVRR
ncbi:hypothetical protein HPT25_20890 [Bacillus sp. BRMEA1]|uniref:replicative helicase loader/inhibitor n=1 Tax=Neobacillus endophyticus TaxID=2738405 RepID=UPI00156424E5|nr:replicative helicase loader/inhibitor [Neobacillus endophyticus]NRD79796.1 hypothetical protein [Neobacillus endophyticus]